MSLKRLAAPVADSGSGSPLAPLVVASIVSLKVEIRLTVPTHFHLLVVILPAAD